MAWHITVFDISFYWSIKQIAIDILLFGKGGETLKNFKKVFAFLLAIGTLCIMVLSLTAFADLAVMPSPAPLATTLGDVVTVFPSIFQLLWNGLALFGNTPVLIIFLAFAFIGSVMALVFKFTGGIRLNVARSGGKRRG